MKSVRDALLLYIVTDRTWLNGRTLISQVEAALCGGATCVQLREKDLPYDAFLAEARTVKALAARYGVPFIVNDNVEIAVACGADGVHVGQSDLGAQEVRRRIGPGMILGVSAQTAQQAARAEREGADYLGIGAVFPTATKADADAVSYAELSAICRSVSIPVVAIGGIGPENILRLAGSGIDGVAVVSAVFASADPQCAVADLLPLARTAATR